MCVCVCECVRACGGGEGRGAAITDRYVHQSVECQYKSQFLVAEGGLADFIQSGGVLSGLFGGGGIDDVGGAYADAGFMSHGLDLFGVAQQGQVGQTVLEDLRSGTDGAGLFTLGQNDALHVSAGLGLDFVIEVFGFFFTTNFR